MKKITHGQLFGGIYGFGLAAQWAGIENVWYNDNDHFCCEVVRARIKDGQIKDKVKIYECDIKNIGTHNLESVDIISAGVPCEPASVAGNRKGKDDDNWLWPEAIRVFGEIEPAIAIFENPPGILSLDAGKTFNEILYALEAKGYTIEIFNIASASQKAWHRRERIWIIAYSDKYRAERASSKNERSSKKKQLQKWHKVEQFIEPVKLRIYTNGSGIGLQRGKQAKEREKSQGQSGRFNREFEGWEVEPPVDRVVPGFSSVLDRGKRIKALGKAVTPQIPYIFFSIISQILNNLKIKTT